MTELIKNEIGDNTISTKIGDINSLESKIKDSYKEIYETKGELQDLKKEITNNLSGKTLKELLEKELTADHVKNVLKAGIDDPSIKQATYSTLDAGITFNMQLALAKLGGHFDKGIDGMYGKSDTGKRVQEFQKAWNAAHPEDTIIDTSNVEDTLVRIVAALDDPQWDVSRMSGRKLQNQEGTNVVIELPKVTAQEAIKDRQAMIDNHLEFMPQDGYEFVDPTDPANIAMKVKGKRLMNTPFMSYEDFFKDPNMDKYHLGLKPVKNYEWADGQDSENYATKLREGGAQPENNTDVEDENNSGTITSADRKSKIKAVEGDFPTVEEKPMPAQNVYGPEEPLEGMTLSYNDAIKDRETMERNHLRFVPQEGYEWAGNYPDNLAVRKTGTMVEDAPMISHADVLRYLKEGSYPVDIKPERGYDWLDKSADDNYATSLQRRKTIS